MAKLNRAGEEMLFRIEGMTCGNCENRIVAAVKALPGILDAKATAGDGRLTVRALSGENQADLERDIVAAVAGAGYRAARGAPASRQPFVGFLIGLALVGVFALAGSSGILSFIPRLEEGVGLGMIFIVGLLSSLHCVSMCGGIALTQSLGNAANAEGTIRGSTRPSGFIPGPLRGAAAYNLGRIAGYTTIGGIVGALGSALSPGPYAKAAIMAAAGLFMILMGMRLIGWIRLPRLRLPFLAAAGKRAGTLAASLGPFAVGLANALMPCGPLQSMQVLALASGSARAGALAMFAFSAGTVPLMLVFGAAGSLLSARLRATAVRAGAVLVVAMGVAGLGRAWALAGLPAELAQPQGRPQVAEISQRSTGFSVAPQGLASETVPAGSLPAAGPTGVYATLHEDYQAVSIDLRPDGYAQIVVLAGLPVRFNIRASQSALNGCNGAVVVPAFSVEKRLAVGDNILEFLPQRAGIVPYTCWMGMMARRSWSWTTRRRFRGRIDGLVAGSVPGAPELRLRAFPLH